MSGFVHPEFMWLAGLALAPLVIHLLFRLRPQVVRWPAMEILLAAMKKTRRRTRFEQLVLIALRMALAVVAAMLVARPLFGDSLGALLESGPATEHVVVLDDTLSMGETANGESSFDAGVRSVLRLADKLAERSGRSRLTVLGMAHPRNPILASTAMNVDQAAALRSLLEQRKPTFISQSPDSALERANDLLASSDAALRVLHVVGDFRQRDWPVDGQAIWNLRKTAEGGVHVRLVDAAPAQSAGALSSLTLESLVIASSPTAVGVPITFEASIRNHSQRVMTDVAVEWRIDGKPAPRTLVKSIGPGAAATARLTSAFRDPGSFAISAKLSADSLLGDNERFAAVTVVDRTPILVIDGDERQAEARFLATALDPGGDATTGWAPTIRTLDAIRQPGLSRYRSVVLINVPSVVADDAKILGKYVADGGSLCLFVGPQSSREGWKALEQEKLLPAAIGSVETLANRSSGEADIETSGPWVGKRFAFLDAVTIGRRVVIEGKPAEGAEVLLSTRDRKPLVLAHGFGRGRTALVLTSAGPIWNDWVTNPSYVVFQLELQAQLTSRKGEESSVVGDKWTVPIDLTQYRRTAILKIDERETTLTAENTADGALFSTASVESPGFVRLSLQSHSGSTEYRMRPFNIDPGEGDLRKAPANVFSKALEGTSYRWERADAESEESHSRSTELRDVLIALLLILFFAELAWARRVSRK